MKDNDFIHFRFRGKTAEETAALNQLLDVARKEVLTHRANYEGWRAAREASGRLKEVAEEAAAAHMVCLPAWRRR